MFWKKEKNSTKKINSKKKSLQHGIQDKELWANYFVASSSTNGIIFWSIFAIVVSLVFISISTYHAYWFLGSYVGSSNETLFTIPYLNYEVSAADFNGLIAVGLVAGGSIVACYRGMKKEEDRSGGSAVLLWCLIAFSAGTSALNVATSMQDGYDKSVREDTKVSTKSAHLQSLVVRQQLLTKKMNGANVSDTGELERSAKALDKQIISAEAKLVEAEATGGSAKSTIHRQLSSWVGLTITELSIALALLIIILMEALRIYLAGSAAEKVRDFLAMSDFEELESEKKAEEQTGKKPQGPSLKVV